MSTKILHLISTPDAQGAEKQLGLLADGLPRDRFAMHVCVLARREPNTRNEPTSDGAFGTASIEDSLGGFLGTTSAPRHTIDLRWQRDPVAFWRLKRHVEQLRPDVIHSWTPTAAEYGCAVTRVCGVRHHVAAVHPSDGRAMSRIARRLYQRCDRIVINGPASEDAYRDMPLPAERVRVIPNAVEPLPPSGTSRGQLLAQWQLPPESRLIGSIGRLVLHRRIKDAIWAADLLKVIRKDVHLLIIGDGPHAERLRKFRDQVVIRDAVHFLGRRDDLPHILPHLDVFWSTGGQDVQSNALMEAMAAGVPSVATDLPANRDLIVPDASGYLVPIGDRAAFARHANRLLDDAELATRLGQAGQLVMAERFSVQATIDRYAELYAGL